MHSIRVICVDSYQAAPIPDVDPTFSHFRGSDIKQVPILRIFGITLEGEKVCLHIHGVFPYMYVPYTGQIPADILAYRLASSLDAAINVSMGSAKAGSQHVYKIQQVSGIPYYGYHRKRHHFFKIYFYNPHMIKRAADLLQSGSVLDQSLQPHESHIPYTQQFMIDYNIYGMSMINLKTAKYRHDSSHEHQNKLSSSLLDTSSSSSKEFLPYTVTKKSTCKIEIDAWASDILNREEIEKGMDLNPGIAAIWDEEKARRAHAGLGGSSQLTYPSSPERSQAANLLTDNDIYYQTRLVQRLSTLESQNDESSMSPNSENFSYPVPVSDDSKLLNASLIEIHAGPLESFNHSEQSINLNPDLINESINFTQNSHLSLDSSDLDLIDVLANLSKDQEVTPSSIDADSILGSQKSQFLLDFSLDQEIVENNEEEEEEVPDLNITNLELDSLNLSSWEVLRDNSQIQSYKTVGSQFELALETADELAMSDFADDIPQLDGPIDDKNIESSQKTDDPDITLQRKEFVVCEYKPVSGNPSSVAAITPRKRRRKPSSEDECLSPRTKKKTNDFLTKSPKTPRRTPSKRSNKLTSPSCPSRTYSPLNLEIINSPKTPKNSPCTTPKKSINPNILRKRIFVPSPVKESSLEKDEKTSPIIDSEPNIVSLQSSEELFKSLDSPARDDTLVEDSNDSLETIVPSPLSNPVIINESESSDASSSFKEYESNSISYNFPHDVLPILPEEEPDAENEISFSQLLESKKKLFHQNKPSVKDINPDKKVTITPKFKPPSREHIINTMELYGIPKCDNIKPFFSNPDDVKNLPQNSINNPLHKARGKFSVPQFRSSLKNVTGLEEWRKMKAKELGIKCTPMTSTNLKIELGGNERVRIEPLKRPPSVKKVEDWVKAWEKHEEQKKIDEKKLISDSQKSVEVKSTSQKSEGSDSLSVIFNGLDYGNDASKHLGVTCGQIEFTSRISTGNVPHENLGNTRAFTRHQFLTIFCAEVHVLTRPDLLPDPRHDPIAAIFYAIHNDVPPDWTKAKPLDCGVIIVDANKFNSKFNHASTASHSNLIQPNMTYVEKEEDLFETLVSIIDKYDPEIFTGWDLEFLSWGYMFQRASVLGKNLSGKISRIPDAKYDWEAQPQESHLGILAEVRLPGRIVLDVWRVMRYEIALMSYTYENIMYHVLNERVPHYSYDVLTKWWSSPHFQWRVIDHYSNKVLGIHRILHHLDIINRTSEHARLYGIQFFEVFCRGSQFRVESMMLRLAKPSNYIPVSPTSHQRGCMRAPESLPLVMEPESTMYSDPIVVLDFQSLYPSIIIAYNYCFSTCLGRVSHIGSPHPFEFGCTNLKVSKDLATKLKNKLNYAPCGVAFVKKEVRQGIIPRMLTEILHTRFMVKKAMKDHPKEDRALQRALHSRQLGLKLIANVTYGYTAANFSGRMPCIEVGDSVVSKGKETLERAIKTVESTSRWGARVIYGDTDSLFVLLKGKSREEAFEIGAEIADTVTAENPKPVKLKFEKVMQPCILQTKKRYCGYMYENLNDKPTYLAKGIETVRRDGCPAVSKILEKSLKILFDTKDVSQVKQYVVRQLDKIMSGRASIQDLTFAKEFRGLKGYKPTACVPSLELTRRLIKIDPRAVPRSGARVPYIIVAGPPNVPLIRCIKTPMELIRDPGLRPNATYYITKCILPPLNRCLQLIGVDAMTWFMEMPHRQNYNRVQGTMFFNTNKKQKTTISQYLCNTTCLACGQSCDKGVCKNCLQNLNHTLVVLHEKCRQYERIYSNIKKVCESCIGVMDANSCTSLDCPIFYRRMQAQRDNTEVSSSYDIIQCIEYL